MKRLSPLALLHPTAPPDSAVVLGDGCPPRLLPEVEGDEPFAELVILAPRGTEIAIAAEEAVRRVSDTGIVVAWGGPIGRRRLCRLLTRQGFIAGPTVLAAPGRKTLVAPPRAARLAAAILAGGVVLRRHRSPAPLEWVGGRPAGGFAIRASPRSGALLLACFDRGGRTTVNAKLSEGAAREYALLTTLGPGARLAGAIVPETRLVELQHADALVQPSLRGEIAARALARRGGRAEAVLDPLTGWLAAWGNATKRFCPLAETGAYADLLDDVELLAPQLGTDYASTIRTRCALLAETAVPTVAAHRDLTMWNVIIDGRMLGIIDWESATDDAFPLVDFDYAAVDALAAGRRYRDRVRAFSESLTLGTIAALRERLADALDVPRQVRELASHACWLHHAANEQRHPVGPEQPFLEIAKLNARG